MKKFQFGDKIALETPNGFEMGVVTGYARLPNTDEQGYHIALQPMIITAFEAIPRYQTVRESLLSAVSILWLYCTG